MNRNALAGPAGHGRRALVVAPNTAIRSQWLGTWRRWSTPATVAAGHDRELSCPLTVLTYQALATLSARAPACWPPAAATRSP